MPTNPPERIICPGCKAAFKYRPELAGKRVKCKCGSIITIPGAPPASAPITQKSPAARPPAKAPPAPVQSAPPEEEPLRPAPLPAEPPQEPDDIYDVSEPTDPIKPVKPPPLAARAPAAASDAPPPGEQEFPSMYRPKRSRTDESADEKKNVIRIAMIAVALLLVIGGAIYGIKMFGHPSGPPKPQLGEDADVQDMMDNQPYKEVHAWFAQDHDRIMGPWNEGQALHMADTWTKQGAKQVLAFGSRMSTIVVIELPDAPDQRAPIFQWQADWHKRHDQKVQLDVGQKYLIIRLGV